MPNVVLLGLENTGKSAIFRLLTGEATGDETNIRGSTVVCRQSKVRRPDSEPGLALIDTPGVRLRSDSETTRLAIDAATRADVLLLVARATRLRSDLEHLLQIGAIGDRRAALVLTFQDKTPAGAEGIESALESRLGIPVISLNARKAGKNESLRLVRAIDDARSVPPEPRLGADLPDPGLVEPAATVFERRGVGSALAACALLLAFGMPVTIAYLLSERLVPVVEQFVIQPLKQGTIDLPALLQSVLAGNYGILTLGWYSFLWAFPVVMLIGITGSLADESGIGERITSALDPFVKPLGISGRDLLPVITGFGCNVVGVLQSRSCSRCTRIQCVSLIAFASACSYQIGAALSVFGSSGRPLLTLPYVGLLVLTASIQARLTRPARTAADMDIVGSSAFLQAPTWRGTWWRVRVVLRQFLLHAMPMFLLVCVAAALLQEAGLLQHAVRLLEPAMAAFGLPAAVAPGVVFSLLRKDGLLVLNESQTAVLTTLSASQTLVLVYLASTLAPCMVTVWTTARELGARAALRLISVQVITSVITTLGIAFIVGAL